MKKIHFKSQNETNWNSFKTELLELAKKHSVEMLSTDSYKNPVLVSLVWDGWRGFDEGIKESFVLNQTDWDKLKPILMAHEIYFGEIAGKHSEVYGKMEPKDITTSSNEHEIETFLNVYGKRKVQNHSFLETLQDNLWNQENLDNLVLVDILDLLK